MAGSQAHGQVYRGPRRCILRDNIPCATRSSAWSPHSLVVQALLWAEPFAARQGVAPTNITSISAAEFFAPAKVWTAHLSMSGRRLAGDAAAIRARTGGGGFGNRFLGPPGGRNGVAGRQGIEFDYVHATLQIDDWTFRDVAVRFKGNGSFLRATRGGSGKISLKVDLNKHVKGQKLAGLTTINFQNNITDSGWMNEVLAYRLYRDAGALAPRTTYAQVYLTVEGEREKRYLGLYSISENVDDNFAEDRFGTQEGRDLQAVHAGAVHRLGPRLDGLQPVLRSQDRFDRSAEAARHRARAPGVERIGRGVRGEDRRLRGPRRLRQILRRPGLAGQPRQPAPERPELLHLPPPRYEPDALRRVGPGLLVRELTQQRHLVDLFRVDWQQPVPVAPLRPRGVPLEVSRPHDRVLGPALRA